MLAAGGVGEGYVRLGVLVCDLLVFCLFLLCVGVRWWRTVWHLCVSNSCFVLCRWCFVCVAPVMYDVCLHVTTVVFAGVPCGEWDLCASLVYGIVVGITDPCHICH